VVETIERTDSAAIRRHELELVGRSRVMLNQNGQTVVGLHGVAAVELQPDDEIVFRHSTQPGTKFRLGSVRVAVVVNHDTFVTSDYIRSQVMATSEEDYIYRIGAALTPSIEERLAALEQMLRPPQAKIDRWNERVRLAKETARVAAERVADLEREDWTGIEGAPSGPATPSTPADHPETGDRTHRP
jgi:hypothetical protein